MKYDTLLRRLCVVTILACSAFAAQSQTTRELRAQKRARTFLQGREAQAQASRMKLLHAGDFVYVFQDVQNRFVMVSSDDNGEKVIGYGQNTAGNMPIQLREWVEMLEKGQASRSLTHFQVKAKQTVAPLLTTVRHQSAPYNKYCPLYTYDDGTISQQHCDVGCVATSLEQILTYYRRTYTLQQQLDGWSTEHYTIEPTEAGLSVDTRLILDDYDESAPEESIDAVAKLSYWLGQALKMQWGIGSSGTYSYLVEDALKDKFGLKYVKYADSYTYSPADWLTMVQNELLAQRPVYYSANTQHMGGHAFVVDGLDEDGLFHVNWGYGGAYDGFFDLAWLYTGERPFEHTEEGQRDGFYVNHEAVFIHPDAQNVSLPEPINRTGDEIEVSSYEFIDEPYTGMYTRLLLRLTNTSDKALTTPAVLFTSPQGAANPLAGVDYIGYSSSSLNPGETCERLVHVKFNSRGARTLYISPDGVAYKAVADIDVAGGRQAQMTFDEPQIEFVEANAVKVTLHMRNEDTDFRTGRNVIYELLPLDGVTNEGPRHPHVVYLAPEGEMDDEVTFTNLDYGMSYKILIRSPWNVVREIEFEIAPLPEEPAVWRNINGVRIRKPVEPGVYIKNKSKVLVLPEQLNNN
ncbi:MAG: C10 family peptidase [Alloprevotella sp.]|nr:C10 family peptidase [Alloprevotella sp.]